MDKHSAEPGRIEVSVVVPVLNEQDNLSALCEQITETLKDKYDYEIVFVTTASPY